MSLLMKKLIFLIYLILFSLLIVSQSFAENLFKVRWVNDGDTIVLSDGRRVRYIGINAPEVAHEDKKAEPLGDKARDFNKKLVFQKKVRLEFGRERYDQYGRLLAYVFLRSGVFANARIIGEGYAFFLPRSPNVRYNALLLRYQRKAMSAKKGIWKNWKEKERNYIGNRRSKRFHTKTCPFGKSTDKRNRIFFLKKWDAFWAGYAPCKKCIPQ